MTVESVFKTLLEADATLVAAATGGIYDLTEAGHMGLNRTSTPSAWDSNGVIKPTILVRERASNPGFNVPDDDGQVMDTRQICEVWFYHDSSFATIATMKNRVYSLLHAKRISGAGRVDWAGDVRPMREIDLDAWVERSDYLIVAIRAGS